MLFKVLHGDKSRISTDVTPYHEGYCYVTHDGDFYVDMNNERVKLNAKDAETLTGVSYAEIKEYVDSAEENAKTYTDEQINEHNHSWNDLTDKPFGEETGMVEILSEYTMNSDPDLGGLPALGLVEGNTYLVELQGEEYSCVAWKMTRDGMTVVGLGDVYTVSEGELGTEATGEPFALIEYPPEVAAEIGTNAEFAPLAAMSFPIILSVSGEGTVIKPIDGKYLPEEYVTEAELESAIAAIPTPDVSGQINSHNTNTSAHADIRERIDSVAGSIPNITIREW